ncbi:hypothetical protein Taro_025642 [Colocasia esculenta]|uniref:Uncharacterized protein n=1 Tax=Colocasia esculenta TaxID=4460 RepID=A0A843VET3_COLES|nr:hypothetical protein [Colocasia esculenta]
MSLHKANIKHPTLVEEVWEPARLAHTRGFHPVGVQETHGVILLWSLLWPSRIKYLVLRSGGYHMYINKRRKKMYKYRPKRRRLPKNDPARLYTNSHTKMEWQTLGPPQRKQ